MLQELKLAFGAPQVPACGRSKYPFCSIQLVLCLGGSVARNDSGEARPFLTWERSAGSFSRRHLAAHLPSRCSPLPPHCRPRAARRHIHRLGRLVGL